MFGNLRNKIHKETSIFFVGTKADEVPQDLQALMAKMEESWKNAFPSEFDAPDPPADGVKRFHQVSSRKVRSNDPHYQQSFRELVSAIIKSVENQRRMQVMRVIAGIQGVVDTLESMARAGVQRKKESDTEHLKKEIAAVAVSFGGALLELSKVLRELHDSSAASTFVVEMLLFVNQKVQNWGNKIDLRQQLPRTQANIIVEEFLQICIAFLSEQPAKHLFDEMLRQTKGPDAGSARGPLEATSVHEWLLSQLDFKGIFSQFLRTKIHKLEADVVKDCKPDTGSPEWIKGMLTKLIGMVDFKAAVKDFLEDVAEKLSMVGLLAWLRSLTIDFDSDEFGDYLARNLSTKELDDVQSQTLVLKLKARCLQDMLSVGALKFEGPAPGVNNAFQDSCGKPIPVFLTQNGSRAQPELAMVWLYDTTAWTDPQRKLLWTSIKKVEDICADESW